MATNKHAQIRYNTLDQCFSNWGRRYYIEDLVEACNQALYDFTGITDGVKKRQIFDDINFMESSQGWSIELNRIKDGRRVYYRYFDKSFSIKNQPILQSEINQINETLLMLARFKGMPQFNWIEELSIRLETAFNLKHMKQPMVGFEQNPYLKGLEFFQPVLNAIRYQRVLIIQYKSFKQTASESITFHPYFLKQYNSRWFVFGLNQTFGSISNLALDRIISLNETAISYIENHEIDFEEYFEDVLGVTLKPDQIPQKIVLEVSPELWPYIETKPIHGSQKVKQISASAIILELNLIINYELITTIFSFGEKIKVIEPESLKQIITDKARKLLANYF